MSALTTFYTHTHLLRIATTIQKPYEYARSTSQRQFFVVAIEELGHIRLTDARHHTDSRLTQLVLLDEMLQMHYRRLLAIPAFIHHSL
jgi:hypothetical protein